MKKFSHKNNGYAILFTVVIISVISVIAIGLSNSTYKQLLLSSVAKDSQVAFYESDTATECALYEDIAGTGLTGLATGTQFNCGINAAGNPVTLDITVNNGGASYDISDTQKDTDGYGPCFEMHIDKIAPAIPSDPTQTSIFTRGYNTCNKKDPRAVEREIEVNY